MTYLKSNETESMAASDAGNDSTRNGVEILPLTIIKKRFWTIDI
jgi:hypothetical protein